ncbi:ATP-binding domain-containing protein [Pseudomonas benzenivorans]|uniref:DNA 3'-5' helicase II n=1 Tax=Pseudomonas benzenivorans TaxID=556533 RepID=A0ABZ0PW58_9PSED|nr:ATP-binding domain-containing protein [Pseudomonas benzenivorans]WPC04719.1 ATP-binding domain-containing protein [Pseudomonas benzenivorans]
MTKQISEACLRKVAREELEILEGMINYAERMIREGDLAYRGMKRNAYGKALVIERENGGGATFRLGMDPLVYPKASSGYATPHSPVGRLCAVAGMGFEGYSKAWGDYQVTEARQFRRHNFEELEQHARNFLAMGVENAGGQGNVMDLRAFLGKVIAAADQVVRKSPAVSSKQPSRSEEVQKPVATVAPVGRVKVDPTAPANGEAKIPEISLGIEVSTGNTLSESAPASNEPLESSSVPAAPVLQILDDDEEEGSSLPIADVDDLDDDVGGELTERMSLDEHFFLNRTLNQDKIISRAPVGPMWVEGVAGSGKTSAALGRTKMLCDFNSNEVTDRETFRSILGDDFDYWEGEFAGKFSQDGSVGFVRTAELIQYLKETCSRLGMPGLPVLEYHELRSRLRSYRHLESSGSSGKRFKHSSDEGHSLTTTLAWLNAARLALARVIAVDLRERLVEVESEHLQRFTAHQRSLFAAARQGLEAGVDELAQELLSPLAAERSLYRLAARLLEKIQSLAQRILGPVTLSIHLGGHIAYGEGVPELAQRLAELPVDLFQQPNQVFVLYRAGAAEGGEALPCVSSSRYQFLSADNQPLSFNAALQASLEGASVRVLLPSLASGDGYEARFMPVNELFIPLGTPRSLLYLEGGALKWLKVGSGVGSQVLSDEDEQARTSVRKIFQQVALDRLAKPLKNFAGLYAKALYEYADSFPDAAIAWQVLERLEEQRLSDSDIDLLLCLAHDLSAGVTAKLPASLREAPFYQSVFVDEVQDFSEQQIYLMTSQADPRYSAITVVGDRSQQLLRNEEMHIANCFPIGTRPELVVLDENLRQKGQPDLAALSAVLRQLFKRGADTDVQQLDAALVHDQVSEQGAYTLRGFALRDEEYKYLCELIAAIPENKSVAVVLPDQKTARALHYLCAQVLEGSFRKMSVSEQIDLSKKYLVHFTSVLHVKGLEFDVVLLPMVDQYDLGQPVFRNRLYVGCTRARQRLVMSRLRVS